MEKEFIPYEQALELKELGFDEPCFFAFDNCSTPMRCTDLRTEKQKFYGVNYNSSSYTSQPSYSQAFRWFREKYNIVHEIVRKEDKNNREFIAWVYTENDKIEVVSYWTALPYKQAELACLKKLIEIIKNK